MATTDKEIATHAVREAAMHKALTRHRDNCPARRVEVSQRREALEVVRCIDCGEQTTIVTPIQGI